eukprot:6208294-Pleurochrysis_carterae.AAC.2
MPPRSKQGLYCGLGRLPPGKEYGKTVKECALAGQLRMYGYKTVKITPEEMKAYKLRTGPLDDVPSGTACGARKSSAAIAPVSRCLERKQLRYFGLKPIPRTLVITKGYERLPRYGDASSVSIDFPEEMRQLKRRRKLSGGKKMNVFSSRDHVSRSPLSSAAIASWRKKKQNDDHPYFSPMRSGNKMISPGFMQPEPPKKTKRVRKAIARPAPSSRAPTRRSTSTESDDFHLSRVSLSDGTFERALEADSEAKRAEREWEAELEAERNLRRRSPTKKIASWRKNDQAMDARASPTKKPPAKKRVKGVVRVGKTTKRDIAAAKALMELLQQKSKSLPKKADKRAEAKKTRSAPNAPAPVFKPPSPVELD